MEHVSLAQRLDVLRSADPHGEWQSLDDTRVCAICNREFIGRQIDIRLDDRGHFQLRCPSQDCPADQRHWLIPQASGGRGRHETVEVDFMNI